jgi:predicted cobalt transporter CbtA
MHELEHSPRYRAVNRAIWLVGTAVVAAHGVALLIYGPGMRAAAEEAAQQQTVAEHALVCDSLGEIEGSPRRERCHDLLLKLQQRHEQSFMARTSGPF